MKYKKTLTLFILFPITAMLNAQFKKGDKMVGATIGSFVFNSSSIEVSFPSPTRGYSGSNNSYGLKIEPVVGWFISEKTVLGLSLNINPAGQKTTYQDNGIIFQKDKSNNFNIGIGGFARNYFNSAGSFFPYGQFGINFGMSTVNTEGFRYYDSSPDYKNTYNGKSSGGFFANSSLQIGLTKILGDYTGLDFYAGYNFSYTKNTFTTTTLTDTGVDGSIDYTSESEPTTKITNHGFILGIGFQIFLKGKK